MFGFDSFTIAVLAGAAVVLLIFVLMTLFDKGKPVPPPTSAPAKGSGKR
jgi:hypothetical protein